MDARHLYRGKRVDTGDWVQGNILHSSPDEMFITIFARIPLALAVGSVNHKICVWNVKGGDE